MAVGAGKVEGHTESIFASPDDRQLLLAVLLHCADIGNSVMPYRCAERWAAVCLCRNKEKRGEPAKHIAGLEGKYVRGFTVINLLDQSGRALSAAMQQASAESKCRKWMQISPNKLSSRRSFEPILFRWAKAVTEEFFAQGDQEAALGLPISPLMDRSKSSLPLSQINFIEFIVAPLFFKVSALISDVFESFKTENTAKKELFKQ